MTIRDRGWEYKRDVPAEVRDLAACRDVATYHFFPPKGNPQFGDYAKSICATCPALEACREYGLSVPGLLGIFGGLNEEDRRKWRKRRRAA